MIDGFAKTVDACTVRRWREGPPLDGAVTKTGRKRLPWIEPAPTEGPV
jgi:hypothetical protein